MFYAKGWDEHAKLANAVSVKAHITEQTCLSFYVSKM